jgi:5'-nucleotidase
MKEPYSRRRILLVNDDGLDAPGLALLEELARGFSDDVWVVAPDEERSGTAHSISIPLPIRVERRAEKRYAVKGTPADCVLLAMHELLDAPPDVLVSGINRGMNIAEDILYSGTTGAAIEGALHGIPSIALSQVLAIGRHARWETARALGPPILEALFACAWEPGMFVNVNFPDLAPEDVTGTRITRQGQRPPGAFVPERRLDGRLLPYYWLRLAYPPGNAFPGSDIEALRDGAVSVTPLHVNMTAERFAINLEASFAAALTQRES